MKEKKKEVGKKEKKRGKEKRGRSKELNRNETKEKTRTPFSHSSRTG